MAPMWKYDEACGEIIKTTPDGYIVVKWVDIPGEWYYTTQQAQKLEIINESR